MTKDSAMKYTCHILEKVAQSVVLLMIISRTEGEALPPGGE